MLRRQVLRHDVGRGEGSADGDDSIGCLDSLVEVLIGPGVVADPDGVVCPRRGR
jgi:hypothetical protein